MSLGPAQWMEIGFDLTYLVIIYVLVAWMSARLSTSGELQPVRRHLRNGFLLLALGDTGHVGFRVIALLRGGLEAKVDVAGGSFGLVGAGALATAITITFLYMLLLDTWRLRFGARRTPLYWGLMSMGVLRLALFIPAQNHWGDVMPPLGWSLLRNAPLVVLGLGVAVLMIRDGRRSGDKTFVQFGALIVLSYAFYAPVILFVQAVPAIGVLMVPKTVVYLVMAWLAYLRLFKHPRVERPPLDGKLAM